MTKLDENQHINQYNYKGGSVGSKDPLQISPIGQFFPSFLNLSQPHMNDHTSNFALTKTIIGLIKPNNSIELM